MTRRPPSRFAPLLATLILTPLAFAYFDLPGSGIAQPTIYESPDGTCKLDVKPDDRFGRGTASYAFTDSNKTLWSGERPYTLRAVNLGNDGITTGLAYHDRQLRLIILDKTGNEILNDNYPQRIVLHSPAIPYVKQLITDPDRDLFIARVVLDQTVWGAEWWIYRRSTGELLERFAPKQRHAGAGRNWWIVDVKPVPETPFLLVHWFCQNDDWTDKDHGGQFVLIDQSGHPYWILDAEKDYEDIEFRTQPFRDSKKAYFDAHPAITPGPQPGRFSIRLFKDEQQITYQMTRPEDQWMIQEVSRDPRPNPESEREAAQQPSQDTEAPTEQSTRSLNYLGPITLAEPREPPLGQIIDFTFDHEGNIAVWKYDGDKTTLAILDAETGRQLAEHPFNIDDRFCLQWSDNGLRAHQDFVVMKRLPHGSDDNPATLVNFATGKQTALNGYPNGFAHGIARTPDAIIVSQDDNVAAYSPDWKEIWSHPKRDDNWHPIIGSARRLTVTTDDTIAVLCSQQVELFDKTGTHLGSAPLKGIFSERATFLHEIVADHPDGFLICRGARSPMVARFTSDGQLRDNWTPRHPDGTTFNLRGVRVAPDGRRWTSDGQSIMRLTNDGVVDHLLGNAPDPQTLHDIAALTVSPQGRIFAVAKGTGAVHVFDHKGRRIRVDEPDPADFPGTVEQACVVAGLAGDYFLQLPGEYRHGGNDYLHFSADGQRQGTVTFNPGLRTTNFGPGWAFQPTTGYRCGITGNENLTIIDRDNQVIHQSNKRPDGRWYTFVSSFSVSPTGNMAVLTGTLGELGGQVQVDVYAPDGTPQRIINLPPAREHYVGLAYGQDRIIVAGNREVILVDPKTGESERYALPEPPSGAKRWAACILPERNELWLHESRWRYESRTIHRYQLPRR